MHDGSSGLLGGEATLLGPKVRNHSGSPSEGRIGRGSFVGTVREDKGSGYTRALEVGYFFAFGQNLVFHYKDSQGKGATVRRFARAPCPSLNKVHSEFGNVACTEEASEGQWSIVRRRLGLSKGCLVRNLSSELLEHDLEIRQTLNGDYDGDHSKSRAGNDQPQSPEKDQPHNSPILKVSSDYTIKFSVDVPSSYSRSGSLPEIRLRRPRKPGNLPHSGCGE